MTMSPKKLTKASRRPRNNAANQAGPIIVLVGILSVVSYVSQVILHPVYGSVGTALHHYNVVFTIATATSLSAFLGIGLEELPQRNWRGIALILICAPPILPNLFRYSARWGPLWGPILTQAIMTWPCVFFTSHDISRRVADVIGKQKIQNSLLLPTILTLSVSIPLTVVLHVTEWKVFAPFFQPFIGIFWSRFSLLLYLGVLALFIDNIPKSRNETSNLLIAMAIILPTILLALNQPHITTGVTPGLLARLPPEYTYLDRRESITGMITVVENSYSGYRVLKCDHSLLGGLWTGLKRKELTDDGVTGADLEQRSIDEAESVYTAFLVQTAVRLIRRPRTGKSALIIGLGVGITAKSFHKSGMSVNAIEIDPVIHRFAEEYFGLPKIPVFYQDGRTFVENSQERWDYIIHDVFTGGNVPAHLFTREMWIATKRALDDFGVLVVNVVGSLEDISTKAVISTLLSEFDYCRGFKDPLGTGDGPVNMIIFCASFPIQFRNAVEEDFQGSILQEGALSSFTENELRLVEDESLIVSDRNNHLNSWQVEGALEHWRIIRTVLAEEVWENY